MRSSDLEGLLRSRRSVRSFLAEVPPDPMVERVLELAIQAPSASNKQPWRFLVVKNAALISEMAAIVRARVLLIAKHVPESSQPAFLAYGDYFTRFGSAPLVIVPIHRGHTVLSNLVDDALLPSARDAILEMERDSGLVGTSLALMNLLLAAHAEGLGASAMTGPLVAKDALCTLLGVPKSWGIVAIVAMGYAAKEPRPTERKRVDNVTRWIR